MVNRRPAFKEPFPAVYGMKREQQRQNFSLFISQPEEERLVSGLQLKKAAAGSN